MNRGGMVTQSMFASLTWSFEGSIFWNSLAVDLATPVQTRPHDQYSHGKGVMKCQPLDHEALIQQST
eukprot:2287181-Amphidinium_carterae.1